MALHARGLARAAGATGELVDRVAAELAATGEVKADRAREVLARLCNTIVSTPEFPRPVPERTGGELP
ncbi:MAG: hypothetical protein H0T89_27410 [Deltaproteobacteria bacterium]|nr:hypothetical protein [Deltaproteobacteria bacterium]